jgi:type I restriction enzyme S subunit
MNLLGIRPNKSKVLPEFLNYYFLSKDFNSFIKSISNQSVNQASFASSKLKKLRIPLPRLEEQKAIVAKLDRAQRLIDIDKAMLAKYDQLIQSVFLDMFGDPVTNPKGWEIKKLGDVGTLGRGKSKHRPRNDPSILGGKYPLIQTGDVSNAGLFITDYDSTYNEQGLKQSKLWDKGTLCITIAANIAKVGILDFAACFPDSVVGFKSEQASSVFIYSWMGFLQDIIEEQAPVSAQKNINLRILRDLDIIFPPLELQKKYESAVLNIQIEINRVTEVNLKSEELFNSLVEGVFG